MQEDFTISEKIEVTAWFIFLGNLEECRQRFEEKFQKKAPSKSTIWDWKKKLLETGNLASHKPRSGRKVSASGDENVREVLDKVAEDRTTSTRVIAATFGVSQTTVCRILIKK